MSPRKVVAVVLGAGAATRFGGGKLDALLGDKPVGRYALDLIAAVGLADVAVVAPGSDANWVPDGTTIIVNEQPAEGLARSVSLAASHAVEQNADALLLLLADMPFVRAETLKALLNAAEGDDALAAVRYPDGTLGPPALFGRSHLAALIAGTGESGARGILRDRGASPIAVEDGELRDIDTRADLAQVQSQIV